MRKTKTRVLALITGALICLGVVAPVPAHAVPNPLHVYVVVLDGLRPSEVGVLTPNLSALRAEGTWFEQARAVFPAETLPNHVAMMTGVLPQRNGVIGNQYWEPNEFGVQATYMETPELLDADTLTTRLENSCGALSSATVQSKTYLHGVFQGEAPNPEDPNPQLEADFHWQPSPIIPVSNHAPDQATVDAFRNWLTAQSLSSQQFAFVNLGDIDRSGHTDASGVSGGVSAARQAVLEDTDTLIGQLVGDLQQSGAWENTVLIFTSDHGMDWSTEANGVDVTAALRAAGYTDDGIGDPGHSQEPSEGDFWVVAGGGSAAIYVEEAADVEQIAGVVEGIPGVAMVATRQSIAGYPTLAEMGMDHQRNGDIVAFVEPGWAVRDTVSLNPLPGNHGHPATQQSVLMVTGGHPLLDDTPQSVSGDTVYDPGTHPFAPPAGGPGNLSVAPTVAALFGIGQPTGGYDRPPLYEAFDAHALATHTPCRAADLTDLSYPRPRGAQLAEIRLVPAFEPCGSPNAAHGSPISTESCSPPVPASDHLTVGTPDANGRPPNFAGYVGLKVVGEHPVDLGNGDQADVQISASLTDVRNQGDLSDYTGELEAVLGLRITDRHNGPQLNEPATLTDVPLSFTVPCAATAGPEGGACNVATTADAVIGGLVVERQRTIWGLGEVEVYDGGADGDASTEPNTLFAAQGTFAP